MKTFNLSNNYYITYQDLSNLDLSRLDKLEKNSYDGTTKDGKRVYILKDCFDSLPNEIKNAFNNLKNLSLRDFQNLAHTVNKKAEGDKKISESNREENLKQLSKSGLYPDILKNRLAPFLSLNTQEVLSITSQHFRIAVGGISLKKICEHAAKEGNLEVLKWARENDAPWGYTCAEAARGGHLEVLQWARNNGASWNIWACANAALGGYLNLLEWAHANGAPLDRWTCIYAAIGGHLQVLEWARANGVPWDEQTWACAVANGHLEILKWARANGAQWNDKSIKDAAISHPEILAWLETNP